MEFIFAVMLIVLFACMVMLTAAFVYPWHEYSVVWAVLTDVAFIAAVYFIGTILRAAGCCG